MINSGDVPRVDGQLAVARAFGDKSLKEHLSSEPDVGVEDIHEDTEFVILASDGLWKVCFLPTCSNATFQYRLYSEYSFHGNKLIIFFRLHG